jgi:predicted membrane protein
MAFDPALPPPPASPAADPWHRGRHLHHHHHRRGHGLILGLVLIAWGGLLLLRELGYLDPALRVIDFWPLLLIGFGLSMAARLRRVGTVLVGLAVALLGAGLLAQRLGYPVALVHYWPLLIVAAGLGVIWNGLTRRRTPRFTDERVSADELRRSVSMGALTVVVESQQFRGGALSVTMGEVKADLRRAAMAGEEAALDLSMTMGNIELYVPTSWQVVSDLSPFMGTVEDKTEPRPDATGVQRRLVLRGGITMGTVTIHN